VFAIDPSTGRLTDISSDGGIRVLEGESGEAAEPMGIALYKRPSDGEVHAIVSPKEGGPADYLWQYRLEDDGRGRVTGTRVRRFGNFGSGARARPSGEIEAVAVDDALGYVYYADERYGIRKWHADPRHADAARELAVFGRDDYKGDREGLAVYSRPDGTGFIVSADQIDEVSILRLYPREGIPGDPHRHEQILEVPVRADDTDGLDVTARALPGFPGGLLVAMNSTGRNYLLFDWRGVERRLPPRGVSRP
jgi:3-phytase